jgi:hypothetical protein
LGGKGNCHAGLTAMALAETIVADASRRKKSWVFVLRRQYGGKVQSQSTRGRCRRRSGMQKIIMRRGTAAESIRGRQNRTRPRWTEEEQVVSLSCLSAYHFEANRL